MLSIQTLNITLPFTVLFNYCSIPPIDSRNTRIIYFVQYYYYLSNFIVYLMSHALF